MKNKLKISLTSFVLLAAILACTLPGSPQPTPVSEIQTAAALTLQAIFTASSTVENPAQSISTVTPSPTILATSTITMTPTYSAPSLKVIQQTNCRQGPGQDYDVVFTYLPGKILEIVGRYEPNNFWLVKSPESGGTCWLWGEYVEVSGSYQSVPSVVPPSTATSAPPKPPSLKNYEYSCSAGTMTITIEWIDKATDETGYRIVRNGAIAVELPANSTSYTETIPLSGDQSVEYFIQVYNSANMISSTRVASVSCS